MEDVDAECICGGTGKIKDIASYAKHQTEKIEEIDCPICVDHGDED